MQSGTEDSEQAGRQKGSSQDCLGLLSVLESVAMWACVPHALLAAG